MAEPSASINALQRFERRHDLDALRAIALLLGLVLHVSLSFAPTPWTVKDSQQSEIYYVLFACIHGFRMPLFFMLSGFFCAMLWRKRGLSNLVNHRFKRIFLPLVIGCLTIVPAMWIVTYITAIPSTSKADSSPLFLAVVSGDIEQVRAELQKSASGINTPDSNSGATPLCTAVFLGRTEIAQLLVNAAADVNWPNRSLSTPLHIAAFMGRAKEAALLLKAGADMDDHSGQLGRRWYFSLPISLLIVFPLALDLVSGTFGIIPKLEDTSTSAMFGNFLQATFAWLMTFGSVGLARRLLSSENSAVRYISDSSYWLYLAHLPLVLLAQWLVKDVESPAFLKFVGITMAITAFLMLTYEYGVRYTAIGRLLNGPRTRISRV